MVAASTGESAEMARMALDIYGQGIAVGMEPADAAKTAKDIVRIARDEQRQEASSG